MENDSIERILPISLQSMDDHLNDIAGVRIICSFPSDIYTLAESFLNQDDITLIERKDYIKEPKANGYRSLHLIVEIHIYLHDHTKRMKVELQFRTISMDWWASLEHKICYKKEVDVPPQLTQELFDCAEEAALLWR